MPFARVALFWFGAIKLLGLSPAGELVEALTVKTVREMVCSPTFGEDEEADGELVLDF